MSDQPVTLTEAQIDAIVEKTVDRVFKRIYEEAGKTSLTILKWLAGIVFTGLIAWLGGKGLLK